ncbi:MAG TPA: hypothetical protein VNO54_28275 [Streptosporangiaceae bacterium]|nr:hypothetical protein [Streptosporangiaceae bacterium]
MRVLPGVVVAGRRGRLTAAGAAMVAATVTAVTLAGCSQFNAALGQRQAVVTFRPHTPVSQRLAVRSACGKVPEVMAQPVPSNLDSPYALQQLTFRVDHASDADIARLEKCLAKFPSVVGITLQDSSDMGG